MIRIDITGNKDIDLIILSNLDDRSLFNFFISNPKDFYLKKLSEDESFWRNKLKNKFPKFRKEQEEFNNIDKIRTWTWKKTYLALVYYSNNYFPNEGMIKLAKGGIKNIDLINFFIEKGAHYWNFGMEAAAEGGHRDLIEFFIQKGANYWDWGIKGAAKGGHRDLINFFIEKGVEYLDYGMYGAAEGGHRDLVQFFIEKGARNWNGGMEAAAAGGHRDLVDFFIQKGANKWHDLIYEEKSSPIL